MTQPSRYPSALALTPFGTIIDVGEHTVLLTLAICKCSAFVDTKLWQTCEVSVGIRGIG